MKKNKKDDIVLLKFKLVYHKIFLDRKFLSLIKNHFDKKGAFAAFILAFIENQIGQEKMLKYLEINLNEWIELFKDLYDDLKIIDYYKNLTFNPVIPLENIQKGFDCFDWIINKIWFYISNDRLNIGIDEFHTKQILKNAMGFILYNCIDCKVNYRFIDIISDPLYNQKIIMITYNTNLFAEAKRWIINNCGAKISDLITLLLGCSNDLNYDK